MFRNFERALGPMSDVTVALRFPKSSKAEQQPPSSGAEKQNDGSEETVILVLVDPANLVAVASKVEADTTDLVSQFEMLFQSLC